MGLEIANEVSDVLANFTNHERYDLSSQLSRSSVSMPSNIAEGSGRTDKNFIDFSLSSSFELGTQPLVAHYRGYIDDKILKSLEDKIEE